MQRKSKRCGCGGIICFFGSVVFTGLGLAAKADARDL
tara:strand:- start:434 stop:544 length:111 start_codon:yes stop_codon:yes gene_type:complete